MRVLWRLRPTSVTVVLDKEPPEPRVHGEISVIVPVLDEEHRVGGCLASLSQVDAAVGEIVVIDGGSRDNTHARVRECAENDRRIKLVQAPPVPPEWNGKAWNLQTGLQAADPMATWILMVDADVKLAPCLPAALVRAAHRNSLDLLSVAARQRVTGMLQAVLHPSMLCTLVYRFGPPGRVITSLRGVQANGQCMLASREALEGIQGLSSVRFSRCEDVTLTRVMVATGGRAGFYEAPGMIETQMYSNVSDLWNGWSRSLPVRDVWSRWSSLIGLVEVALVQSLPVALLALAVLLQERPWCSRLFLPMEAGLVCIRFGVLVGVRRAYSGVSIFYWISPLADIPVAFKLWKSVVQKRHVWRGHQLVAGGIG